jgi:Tol biopolymer transport system component
MSMAWFYVRVGVILIAVFAALEMLAGVLGFVSRSGIIAYAVIQPDRWTRPYMVDMGHRISVPVGDAVERVLGVRWSPDGQEIAFFVDGTLMVMMDLETHTTVQFSADGINFTWLSDTSQYLFGHSATFYTVDQDGTNFQELPPGLSIYHSFDVSPNQERVVFVEQGGEFPFAIDVINIDRTGFQQLTVFFERLTYPSWSPDGQHIVFGSNQGDITTDLHVMNADGTDVRNLVSFTELFGFDWSPDSRHIAVVGQNNGVIQLQVVDINGQIRTLIGNTQTHGYHGIEWSPDGRFIVLYWAWAGRTRAFVMLDATSGQSVWADTENAYVWSPDYATRAFVSQDNHQICLLSVEVWVESCFPVESYVIGDITWLP